MQKVYRAASCCAPIFQNWFSPGGTVSGSNSTGPSFEIQLNPIQTNHHSSRGTEWGSIECYTVRVREYESAGSDFTGQWLCPPRLGPSGAAAAWEERDLVGELEI